MIPRLAWAYLRDRPLTTLLNVLLLAIAVAMLVLLLQFGTQARERFERDSRGIDLVVGAKGSPLQLILSSVFHVDQPTGNIPLSSLEMLQRDPAVARAIPLALGDNFEGFRIVGTEPSFLELQDARVEQGAIFANPMEAVLGSAVAEQTGAKIGQKFIGSHGLETDPDGDLGHDHAPFKTVGILAPTGGVVDRLILTSVDSVWDVHGIEHDGHEHDRHEHDAHDHAQHGGHDHPGDHAHDADAVEEGDTSSHGQALQERRAELTPELTALLVTYRNASGAIRIPSMINRQTELQAAVPAIETARLLQLIGASLEGLRIFGWLLALTGGLAVFAALFNLAQNREGDLALLRVMGASRMQVFMAVILEGLFTAALGAATGWLAAHALLGFAQVSFTTLADLGLQPWQPLASEGILVLLVLAIGVAAAAFPAWRVYRIDPVLTLSRTH